MSEKRRSYGEYQRAVMAAQIEQIQRIQATMMADHEKIQSMQSMMMKDHALMQEDHKVLDRLNRKMTSHKHKDHDMIKDTGIAGLLLALLALFVSFLNFAHARNLGGFGGGEHRMATKMTNDHSGL